MTTPTIAPGCNMPCISVSERHPGLWAYTVEATETGLISALGDEEARRSDDRFQHLVFFPTWSSGEMAFFNVKPGEKFWVDAHSDSGLLVKDMQGSVIFKQEGKIVVLFHDSLGFDAVEAYYAQKG